MGVVLVIVFIIVSDMGKSIPPSTKSWLLRAGSSSVPASFVDDFYSTLQHMICCRIKINFRILILIFWWPIYKCDHSRDWSLKNVICCQAVNSFILLLVSAIHLASNKKVGSKFFKLSYFYDNPTLILLFLGCVHSSLCLFRMLLLKSLRTKSR